MGAPVTAPLKVSLVVTVKNEADSISALLESIRAQTVQPDELVITDAGSTDGTLEQLHDFANHHPFLRILEIPGANRSRGRNEAIRACDGDIIAATDAGCRVRPDWLEHLVKPFQEDETIDVVGGWYEPVAETPFERCAALVTVRPLHRTHPDSFMPTARSIAFRKSVWERVGGFPESERLSEDALFDVALKKAKCTFAFAPDAVAEWRVRPNVRGVALQHFEYAQGMGENLANTRGILITSAKYVLGLFLFIAGFFYWPGWIVLVVGFALFFSLQMARGTDFTLAQRALIPTLKIVTELASLWGHLYGMSRRMYKVRPREGN